MGDVVGYIAGIDALDTEGRALVLATVKAPARADGAGEHQRKLVDEQYHDDTDEHQHDAVQ